jgi:hypothetical protein
MAKTSTSLSADLSQHRVLPLAEASAVTSLSQDALRRNHGDKIVRLSARRQGISLENTLKIARGEAVS